MPGPTVAPRPIRVCLVGPSLDILGGQAIQLDRLRRRFESVPEIEVSFVAVNPRLPGVFGQLQRIKYVRTVASSVAYGWTLLRRLRDVDVVHAFSASYWSFLLAPVPAMLVGRLYGKRILLNYRSGEALDHLARSRVAVPLMRLAHAIVTPSGYLVDVFARFGLAATTVFNFVDEQQVPFRARTLPRPRFFSNRNLEPMYNVGCTIRAFAIVQREIPEATLVVAGDGAERGRLQALVAELGLQGVTFLGRVRPEEMGAHYDRADIYLNSPDIDNMPNSVIEAFAAGLPVVTTSAGGIPYIVQSESNGLLAECGDAAGLARHALRLLREQGLCERITKQAKADCLSHYVWPAVRHEWTALYRRVVQWPGAASAPLAKGA
jgi:glycosyltransferase involved in cell wall biosynthesis